MATEPQFIGRGENLAEQIIVRLFTNTIFWPQAAITKILNIEDQKFLDQEIKKHKIDFLIQAPDTDGKKQYLAIEVNYKHGEKAARKWNNIFIPILKKAGIIPVPINDYNCRNLFKLSKDKSHKLSWDDFRDVIDALEMAGVKP